MRRALLGLLVLSLLIAALGVVWLRRWLAPPLTNALERDRSRLIIKLPVPPTSRLTIDGWTSDRRRLIVSAQARLPNGGGGGWQTWLLDIQSNELKTIHTGGEHPIMNPAWKDRLLFTDGASLRWVDLDGKIETPFYCAPKGQRMQSVVISKKSGEIAFYLVTGRFPHTRADLWIAGPNHSKPRQLTHYTDSEDWMRLSSGGHLSWSPDERLVFYEEPRSRPQAPRVPQLVLMDPRTGKTTTIMPTSPFEAPRAPWQRWNRRRGNLGIVRRAGSKEEFVAISKGEWEPHQIPRGGRPSPDQRKYLVFLEDNPDALAAPPTPWWRKQLQRVLGIAPTAVRMSPVGASARKLAYASGARASWEEAFYETSHLWLLTDDGKRRSLVKKYQNATWSPDSKRVYFTRPGEVRVVQVDE